MSPQKHSALVKLLLKLILFSTLKNYFQLNKFQQINISISDHSMSQSIYWLLSLSNRSWSCLPSHHWSTSPHGLRWTNQQTEIRKVYQQSGTEWNVEMEWICFGDWCCGRILRDCEKVSGKWERLDPHWWSSSLTKVNMRISRWVIMEWENRKGKQWEERIIEIVVIERCSKKLMWRGAFGYDGFERGDWEVRKSGGREFDATKAAWRDYDEISDLLCTPNGLARDVSWIFRTNSDICGLECDMSDDHASGWGYSS
jgi:hypothetical protein